MVKIFISYCRRANKDLADNLNERLKRDNYDTWIDEEKMSGNINEMMAQGIETSDIVLILLSKEYCDSENCKRECEYAFKKNKTVIPIKTQKDFKPTGSVDFLTTSLLYIDFTKNDFNTQYSALKDQIEKSRPVSTTSPLSSPNPLSINPGLSIKNNCKNNSCRAGGTLVTVHLGFGSFKIGFPNENMICPICKTKLGVIPEECLFNRCKWRYEGIVYTDHSCTETERKSSNFIYTGDEYERCSEYRNYQWVEIQFFVERC